MRQNFETALKTEKPGLTLRRWEADHAKKIWNLIETNRDYLDGAGEPVSLVYPTYEALLHSILNPDSPDQVRYGIWSGKEVVGAVYLLRDKDNTAEIGYWIGEAFSEKGYATAAVRSLVNYTFAVTDLRKIRAKIRNANPASHAVIYRAQFIFDPKRTQKKRKETPDHGWYVRKRTSH